MISAEPNSHPANLPLGHQAATTPNIEPGVPKSKSANIVQPAQTPHHP